MTAEQLALLTPAENTGTATFSPCGRYRYTLGRRIAPTHLGDLPHLLFVMLNPSTADDTVPDPTITRCLGFTASHGYGAMRVVNLFALRDKDPRALRGRDPVGPDNDFHIAAEAVRVADTDGARIVVAWGACAALSSKADRSMLAARIERVVKLLAPNRLWCLGVTKDGQPGHPLYLPAKRVLAVWEVPHG